MMPADDLSRVHEVDEKYFQRVKALEFTTVHDDGAGLSTLGEADIVLVGPSRVSKSPTSMYLASLGYKTANVSITPATGFPKELAKVRKRIVAFTMQPRRLQQIRKECYPEEQLDGIAYHNLQDVIKELMEAEAEYRRRKYPVIDITNRTIEQVATMVLHQLGMMH